MRFNIKRCLIILLSCVLLPLCVLSSGYSNWFVLRQDTINKPTTGNTITGDSSNSVQLEAGKVTAPTGDLTAGPVSVDFYYWTTVMTPSKPEVVAGSEDTASGSGSSSPTLTIFNTSMTGTKWKEQYGNATSATPINFGEPTMTNQTIHEDGSITKTFEQNQILSATETIKTTLLIFKTYTANVSYRTVTYTQTIKEGLATDTNGGNVFFSSQIISGNLLSRPTPTYTIDGVNYTLIGFYEYNENGEPGAEFDFSKPITVDTNIIVQWSTQPESEFEEGYTSLTQTVNSLTSSLNVYSGGVYDISKDYSYSAKSASLNLGTSTTNTTIKSGATVNLCMNNGAYHYQATKDTKVSDISGNEVHADTGTDLFASVDYTGVSGYYSASSGKAVKENITGSNKRDYTLKLQNDLTIYGKLNIGGFTGATSHSNSFMIPQGSIIGNYVKLDLNGYTITIENGGILHSFGYITDTAGTGKIVVKAGGHLYSQMVITALKGGNNTLWSYSKGISPFENYYFPYLDTTVEIEVSSSGAGNFTAFTKLNLGDLGFTNLYFPVIGGDSSFMFYVTRKNDTDGKVYIKNHLVDSLNTAPYIYYDLHQKNSFTFENVNADFTAPNTDVIVDIIYNGSSVTTVDMTLKLNRLIFPISAFLDLNFYSSTLVLDQKIQILPGSSLMIDSNSELVLDYYKDSTGKAQMQKFDTETISALLVFRKSMPGENKHLSGGILAMDNDPVENSQFIGTAYDLNSTCYNGSAVAYDKYWTKVFKSANVDIYGNIRLTPGNDASAPYALAGNVNVNTFSTSADTTTRKAWNLANLDTLSGVNFRTYDLNIYSGNFYWFGGSSLTDSKNDSANSAAIHFYALPMISNGKAYVWDGKNKIQGTYNSLTGIVTASTQKTYFFKTNNSLLTTSSTGTNVSLMTSSAQDYSIDYTITPTECSQIKSGLITAGSTPYVYFGGLYFPVSTTGVTGTTTTVTADLSKFTSKSGVDYKTQTLTYNSAGYWVR